MTVTSTSKSVSFRGEFYLLPGELPDYQHPLVLDRLLDGEAGGDAALAFLRAMLGEDGLQRFLEQTLAQKDDFSDAGYGEFVAAIYAEYGLVVH